MSVLKQISDAGDWVDVDQPDDDDSDSVIGYYDGEAIKVGFATGDEDDDYLKFRSGPYTVEVREGDGSKQVRASTKPIADRNFGTKLMRSGEGFYELALPSPVVRHLGFDEVLETETRTVNKKSGAEEQTMKRGIYVAIETECEGGNVSLRVRRADESETDYSHVRRVQRKPVSGGYEQYYLYFPRTLVASLGLDGAEFDWTVEDDALVGDVIGAACFNLESAVTAYPEYDELSQEDQTLELRSRGANSQTRLVLNSNQSEALKFDERRDEILQQELQVAFLLECGPNGFTIVAHPNPSALPEDRTSERNTVNASVNNWFGSYDGQGEEPLASKRERAGNQIALNFPKDVAHSVGLTDTEFVWRPVMDNYYDTGSIMLVGRPVESLTEEAIPADD